MRIPKLYGIEYRGLVCVAANTMYLKRLTRIIDFLEARDPDEFRTVQRYIRYILVMPSSQYVGATGTIFARERLYLLTGRNLKEKRFGGRLKKWEASCLIHEAYHVRQYRSGWIEPSRNGNCRYRTDVRVIERNACAAQIRFLRKTHHIEAIQHLEKLLRRKKGWWEGKTANRDNLVFVQYWATVHAHWNAINWIASKNLR